MNYILYSRLIGSYGRLTVFYRIYLRSESLGSSPQDLVLGLVLDLVLDPSPGPSPSWPQTGPKTDLKNPITLDIPVLRVLLLHQLI